MRPHWDVPDYPPTKWPQRRPPLGRVPRMLLGLSNMLLVIGALVAALIGSIELGQSLRFDGSGHPVIGVLLIASGFVCAAVLEWLHRRFHPYR